MSVMLANISCSLSLEQKKTYSNDFVESLLNSFEGQSSKREWKSDDVRFSCDFS